MHTLHDGDDESDGEKIEKVDYHHRHRDGRCANVLLALSALFHNLYEFFFRDRAEIRNRGIAKTQQV